jgi:hypothetical protein
VQMVGLVELIESALFDKISTLSESKTGGYITGKGSTYHDTCGILFEPSTRIRNMQRCGTGTVTVGTGTF